jgi:N,N'-diacetyllegionaminate synthase
MSRVFVIAEAGVNHNGNIEIAKRMVDAASEAGADAVKFQTFRAERLVSKFAGKADYQKKTTGKMGSQLEMIKLYELKMEHFQELVAYSTKNRIAFLSSAFDLESIDLLCRLGLEVFKIPSGEITNLPYLRKIGCLRKAIIMSTGMADLNEVEDALNVLVSSGTSREKITVLHCTTEYPAPMDQVNLLAMLGIKDSLKINIGYSDHTLGTEVSIAAAALGATVIEKHFTLDRNMYGPDHKASLEPLELKMMVNAIRNVEKALGDGVKRPSRVEITNRVSARKSIVAAKAIRGGEVLSIENVTAKRPGTGISPMEWDKVVGTIAKRAFQEDELIEL